MTSYADVEITSEEEENTRSAILLDNFRDLIVRYFSPNHLDSEAARHALLYLLGDVKIAR